MTSTHPVHLAFKSQYRHTLEICLGAGLVLHLALILGMPPMEIAPYSLPPLVEPTRIINLTVVHEIKINDPPPNFAAASHLIFAPEIEPLVLKRVVPVYPSLAREAGAEGTVKVQVTIDTSGRVAAAKVVESDTIQSLRTAAVEAAYGYRFSPARQQGHPVPAHVYLTFEFTLR